MNLICGIPQTITATFSIHIFMCAMLMIILGKTQLGSIEPVKKTLPRSYESTISLQIGSSHTIISHCHYQFSSNCYTPMWHTTSSGGKLLTCWIMYRVDRPTDTYERGFFHCLWWFGTSLVCTDFISILCTKISILNQDVVSNICFDYHS